MPQSLADILIHVVFSTKNRVPFLRSPDVREHLNGYVVRALANLDCPSLITRAVEDHIHILCQHHRTRTFQEEYRLLLQRHGIEFDERYVWD